MTDQQRERIALHRLIIGGAKTLGAFLVLGLFALHEMVKRR